MNAPLPTWKRWASMTWMGSPTKDIHEARIIRDAEVAESGIVRPLQQMESPKDIVAPAYRGTGGRRGATAGFEGNGGAEVGGA